MQIKKIIRLPESDSGLQHNIVRVNNCLIDSKKQDRSRFFRREAVVIINNRNGSKVMRYVMGNPGLSISKEALALDYDAVDALGITYQSETDLEIRRASRLEVWQWFWRHPDQGIQLSIKLGVIGAVLGVLGFLTGITPLLLG